MALDFTLLTAEQIWGNHALEVLKEEKYGVRTSATDLAILLGTGVEFHTNSESDLSCDTWLSSITLNRFNKPGETFYLLQSVSAEGNRNEWDPIARTGAVRPVLSPSETSQITPDSIKKGVNGVDIALYGEYPQTVVSNLKSRILETLLQRQDERLQKTGKTYTFDQTEPDAENPDFLPDRCPEYEYEGHKYVRVMVRPIQRNLWTRERVMANGGEVEENKPCWVRVEPIEWLMDPSGVWVSKKALFSGVLFDKKKEDYNFQKTSLKAYLDTYFAKEIEPSESIEHKRIIEGLKARLAEASDLDKVRADTKPARTPERTEIAARMKRVRRERDVIRAAADKARESGDEKLFEQIAEVAKPSMARAEVVMDKFYARREARRAVRAKKARE